MRPHEITDTYNDRYASVYDDTFLHADWIRPSLAFQLDLIKTHLPVEGEWLDVACGTGYVLGQFPGVRRTGLDLSPSMLARARQRNPDATFVERDFRIAFPDWSNRFDLVTSMWWAYCLVDTLTDVRALVAQLADWTAPTGTVLLPLLNVNKLDTHNIKLPYVDPKVPGRCMLTGVTWTWIQEDGARHEDLIAPQVEHLVAMFDQHFEDVRVVSADLEVVGEGWRIQDVLVASAKRPEPLRGDLYPVADGRPPGQWEWRLNVNGGALAGMHYPDLRNLSRVAVHIDHPGGDGAWQVQASKAGIGVRKDAKYSIAFRGRAQSPRHVHIGVGLAIPPWSGTGFYERIFLSADWQDYALDFAAPETAANLRIHFDLGGEVGTVELEALQIKDTAMAPPA